MSAESYGGREKVRSSIRESARCSHAPRWLVLFAGLVIVLGPARARAQDAEEFVKRGIELRRSSKDEDALTEFKKAWAISKTPRIEAQMALAEQALGLWVASEEHLLEALTHSKTDPWTKSNRAVLTKALTVIQAHLGTLDVWGTPPGATIFLNEKPIGSLPLEHPVRVADDSAILRVHANGFLEWTRTLRVEPGQSIRQHVELIPEGSTAVPVQPSVAANDNGAARSDARAAGAAPPPEPAAGAKMSEKSSPTATANHSNAQPSARRGLRPYAWGAGAVAVLGVGFGVVETLVANSKRNQFNDMAECGTSSLTTACKTLKDDHDKAGTLATIGYVSGGGLAVLSAVLFIISSSSDDSAAASVAGSCFGDVRLRGLACAFSF